MAQIERVVRVNIALRTASVRQQTFSDLMLFGSHSGPRLTIITSADELLSGFGLDQSSGLYRAAQVGFGQDPGPDRLFVGRRDFSETATVALSAIAAQPLGNEWYGMSDVSHDATEAVEIAAWAEANKRLSLMTFSDIGAGSPVRTLFQNKYSRTAGWYVPPALDAWPEVAAASRLFQILPGGESWSVKQLSGVPAVPLDESLARQVFALSANTYEPVRNLAVTQNGRTFNDEFIDTIRFRDWLEEEMKTRVFRVFLVADKVPFTDIGIGMITQAMRGALELGQLRGGIAQDTVDEETRRIRRGFTVKAPRAHQVSANDRATRILRDVRFSALQAGAIHETEIQGELTLESLLAA